MRTGVDGEGTPGVGRKSGLPRAKPLDGSSEPWGGEKRKGLPDGVGMESVNGLNVVEPA